MDDNANPRVQSHGAAALVNFAEECPKIVLSQYLDVILDKMEQVLSSKFKEVRMTRPQGQTKQNEKLSQHRKL